MSSRRRLSRRDWLALAASAAWVWSRPADAQDAAVEARANVTYADSDPRALSDFRDQLDPYGSWVDDPVYGLVWVPSASAAGEGFAPYLTSGHWALDPGGDWIWVSDYPWGWVVFHYGRWVWIAGTGWAWIPGRRYASAWVVWRVGDAGWDYIGWAPMPPTFVWVGGVAVVFRFGAPVPFVFCPTRHAFARHVHRHLVPPHELAGVAHHTRRWHVPAASTRVGPPLEIARVPASARPLSRVPADPRALGASRPPARAAPPPRAWARARPSVPRVAPRPAPSRVPRTTPARPPSAPRKPPPPHYTIPPRPTRRPAPRVAPPAPVRRAPPPPRKR